MTKQFELKSHSLSLLNDVQLQAIEHLDGPVLVLAGAGTGKTRVLTTRLAYLVATRGIQPFQILAVTFTNKAAQEMRTRVSELIDTPLDGLWLGTFHALANRILRRHACQCGLRSTFTILDPADQLVVIKQIMDEEPFDSKKWTARKMLTMINRWKDQGITPDRLTEEYTPDTAQCIDLYSHYQDRLQIMNACDFGDLLLHTVLLLQRDTTILKEYHDRFHYLLIDEYQDTNVIQYLWLRLLTQEKHNIFCVGDEDQSIYGWRGAEIDNILRFEKDFPGAVVIRLEQNYRSTCHILGAASGIIAYNQRRFGKTLWTSTEEGDKVQIVKHYDGHQEALWIGQKIKALQQQSNWTLDQIAILVRAGFQTRGFEEQFLFLGLPYRILGGKRFYERVEIKDIFAYLRIVSQLSDDLAFARIMNTPRRGLGKQVLQTLSHYAYEYSVSLSEAARTLCQSDSLNSRACHALKSLLSDLDRWHAFVEHLFPSDLASMILEQSGYLKMWQDENSSEAKERLANIKEMLSVMTLFETLPQFLDHVSLMIDDSNTLDGQRVSIMTLHGAKGLEFDGVFLPGWEEGLFPNPQALNESSIIGLEEERRLAYVGLTRARKKVYICYATRRQIFGTWDTVLPSRFITELPDEHIERHTLIPTTPVIRAHTTLQRARRRYH